MSKRKVNNKIIIGDENTPTRLTFDGRRIKYSDLEHQHVSNIYWFNTVLHGRGHNYDKGLLIEIDKRFNGKILPYRPLKSFPAEIFLLRKRELIEEKDGKELIYFNGREVGEII